MKLKAKVGDVETWIKTPQGKLIDFDRISSVQLAGIGDKARVVVLTLDVIQVALTFKTEDEAKDYVDKLTEKLGAVEI